MGNVRYTNSASFRCLEDLQRTSTDLYLIHCGTEHCQNGQFFGPTQRTEYIIHYVYRGAGTYTVGETVYRLQKGQAFLIYPDTEITYFADKADPWSYMWVGFNGLRAEEILKNCGFTVNTLIQEFKNEQAIANCMDQMLASKQLSYSNDLKRQSYLYEYFSILTEEYSQSLGEEGIYDYSSSIYVDQALHFIRHNYNRKLRISDIADYIGINRSYLSYSFQKNLNTSPQQFILDYRMEKAACLLKSSGQSIRSIASSIGYEDALAFSKAFKKYYKLSPSDYRNNKDTLIEYSSKQ